MTTETIFYLFLAYCIGAVTGWFIYRIIAKAQPNSALLEDLARQKDQLSKERDQYLGQYQSLHGKLSVLEDMQRAFEKLQQQYQEAIRQNSQLEQQVKHAQQRLEEQKTELEQIGEKFRTEFKVLAQDIMEDKSRRFTEVNEEKMKAILDPFKNQLGDFKKKVEETYDKESKERFSLEGQIKKLIETSNSVSEQANNLTTALKGNKKVQGNWGEMILESILENSGLIKGQQFKSQEFIRDKGGNILKDENGKGLQPDVTVYYPDDRKIIIDSKVSLVAYEGYVNAETEEEAQTFLNEHIRSIRQHIDGLSRKEYALYAEALEHVLMFVPVEPAFLEALKADSQLWRYAYQRGIILVSPTNLLAILKIVEEMWKVDKQNRNAEEIARQAGAIYEKFVNFLKSFNAVADALDNAKMHYETAHKQLATGRGNFAGQVEKLRKLGAKISKSDGVSTYLPGSDSDDSEDAEEEA
jgi:DNA recombination protein RmuC